MTATRSERPMVSLVIAARAIGHAAIDLGVAGKLDNATRRLTLADHAEITQQLASALDVFDTVLEWESGALDRRYQIVGEAIGDARWGTERGLETLGLIRQTRIHLAKAAPKLQGATDAVRREVTRFNKQDSPLAVASTNPRPLLEAAQALTTSFYTFLRVVGNTADGRGFGLVLESHLSVARHIDTVLTQLVGVLLNQRNLLDYAFEEAGSKRAGHACSPVLNARQEIRNAIRSYQYFEVRLGDDCAGRGRGH